MEPDYVKLLTAFTLLICTFSASMLPLWFFKTNWENLEENNSNRRKRVVSLLSCFGGGIFLGTCLLDLFPDVRQEMNVIFKTMHMNPSFPVAEFLLAFGFLVILVTEQIVLNFQESKSTEEERVPILAAQQTDNEENAENANYKNRTYGSVNKAGQQHNHSHELSLHQDRNSHSILRSLMLVFALSLHSIFEGLAIGLQTSAISVIGIMFAVLAHKTIIAFSLSLNLLHSKLKKSSIIKGNALFSMTSPIGILIGVVVTDLIEGLSMSLASGILQGLAAGTFLYVTFFEILPHELNSNENRMLKMFFLLIGFSTVSFLILVLPD